MRTRLAALPLVAALALGACGGGGDDGATADETARTDEATTGRDEQATSEQAPEATNGTGEIVIGGTTFAFTSESCAIGTSGDTPSVAVTGTGTSGGREYEIEIVRSQPGDNFVERVKLAYSGMEGSVSTRIGAADALAFQVDDREVTATGLQFTGTGGAPSGDGSFTLACEDG